MVSKKILAAAIAAALSSQAAFAALDLDSDATALTYAKEAITSVSSGYTTVAAAGTELDVKAAVGSGVSAGNQIYVRFDLTNAKFATAVVAADLTVAGPTNAPSVQVQSGGAADSSYVIFQITADADPVDGIIDQADVLTLALADLKISTTAGVTVKYAAYDTPASAVNQVAANKLADASFANAITVANVLDATFTADNAVADVADDFTTFVTDGTSTTIGTVAFGLTNSAALLTDGTVVTTLDELIDDAASNVVLSGDLSFGQWDIDGLAIDEETGALESNDLSDLGFGTYDVNVTVDGETTINPGSYSLATDYTAITNSVYGVANESGDLGSITRNGTSVQVPYLTTFTDYNQRVVLVNRSAKAAPYSFAFTTESGVTAAAGVKATGSIPANSTLVLKAADVVTLTGGSRTAATITVTAQEANIDAATTTVNLSDKSTDTVNLIDHSQGAAL